MKLNEKPRVSMYDGTEYDTIRYDTIRETAVKHVWLFIAPDGQAHYQFADETATFDEEKYETIDKCEAAMMKYVEWLNEYPKTKRKNHPINLAMSCADSL